MFYHLNNFAWLSGVAGLLSFTSIVHGSTLSQGHIVAKLQKQIDVLSTNVNAPDHVFFSENKNILLSVGGQPLVDANNLHASSPPLSEEALPDAFVDLAAEISMGDARVKAGGSGIIDIPAHAYTRQANMVPPTAIAQINLLLSTKFRPYVGAGINYTDVSQDDIVPKNINNKTVYQQNTFGSVVQIGADIDLSEKVFLNIDAKKLNKRSSGHAYIGNEGSLDPWVYGIGIGFKFK